MSTLQQNPSPLLTEYRELLRAAQPDCISPSLSYNDFTSSLKPGDEDILLIIDMQNDFLPADAPGVVDGGRFGVAEGGAAIPCVLKLIDAFATATTVVSTTENSGMPRRPCSIYTTRDFHPDDHCSFNTHGGPFPPHCIMGTVGSYVVQPIAEALQPLVQKGIAAAVFKGFSKDSDSFGGFKYDEEYGVNAKRIPRTAEKKKGDNTTTNGNGNGHQHHHDEKFGGVMEGTSHGGPYSAVHSWSGSFLLRCSTMRETINAPPDVMAVLDRVSLDDVLLRKADHHHPSTHTTSKTKRRLFVCGVAFDFCVLDTALNAARFVQRHKNHQQVVDEVEIFIVLNGCRAVHHQGAPGSFGSGFISDPADVVQKLRTHNIKMFELDF